MQKLSVGTRVETTEGKGIVAGYDLEHSDVWRHEVKLDNGKLWAGKNPCFFHNEIKPIEPEN